jgi:hypothetical protein
MNAAAHTPAHTLTRTSNERTHTNARHGAGYHLLIFVCDSSRILIGVRQLYENPDPDRLGPVEPGGAYPTTIYIPNLTVFLDLPAAA